jgi:hypothetical protein
MTTVDVKNLFDDVIRILQDKRLDAAIRLHFTRMLDVPLPEMSVTFQR